MHASGSSDLLLNTFPAACAGCQRLLACCHCPRALTMSLKHADMEEEEEDDAQRPAGEEASGAPHAAGVGNGGASGAAAGQEEPEVPDEGDGEEQDGEGEGEEEEADDDLPSFEFRFETAKLLIELDDNTHAAVEVRAACARCQYITDWVVHLNKLPPPVATISPQPQALRRARRKGRGKMQAVFVRCEVRALGL